VTLALRLASAFSPRKNLRFLLRPTRGRLRPLDGLRAVSMLWVVMFHAGWYLGLDIPVPAYLALIFSRWMLPAWRGDFGVDVFFVLSGFLIAGILIDEREETGGLRLGLFYVRRLARLWPALAVAVLADVLLHGDPANEVWANLLYVNNLIPSRDGTMGWTWSLSIEEQFYLACLWLVLAVTPLRTGGRVRVVVLVALALCGVAAWVVVAGGFTARDSEIVFERDLDRWTLAYDHLYVKPWMRAGALLMGVGAAFVARSPAAMRALARHGVLTVLALIVALAVAGACTHWPLVAGAPRAVEVAFLACYRTAFGACVAFVILLSVSHGPVGRGVGWALSSRFLYPFGQIAYSAYLLNPIVTMAVGHRLAPWVAGAKLPVYPVLLAIDASVTFIAAALVYLFVERPFMELRPRRQRVTTSSQSTPA